MSYDLVEHYLSPVLQKEIEENVVEGFISLEVQSQKKATYIYYQISINDHFIYQSGFWKIK